METFFIDTNLLIQCRDLPQLPWQEISNDEHILLVISRPVLEEIDRHKQSGNDRRAKRCRKITSYFRELIIKKVAKDLIRKSSPKVELLLQSTIENDHLLPPGVLDLTRSDDRIIYAALVYKATRSDVHVQLLTHDTNPLLTAQSCGLDCSIIPDTWLMEPEPDFRDKKIAELERKVKALEKSSPNITIKATSRYSEPLKSVSINVTLFKKLTEPQIEDLAHEAQARSPLVEEFECETTLDVTKRRPTAMNIALNVGRYYRVPKEAEIKKYREEKYPAWVKAVNHFFQEINSKLESPTRTVSFQILLENLGSIPAENLVIEFQALGGLFFSPPKSDDDNDGEIKDIISFPGPPIAPSGAWVSYQKASITAVEHGLFPKNFDIAYLTRNNDRDMHAFYWKDRRPTMIKKEWVLECAEFRHLVQPEQFEIGLIVPPNMEGESGALKCLVTAKNLPEPVEYILPVIINYEKGDTYEKSRQCLDQFLPSDK